MNGYGARIFGMHNKPGGLCTAWKRNGYTIDGCIHHLGGAGPSSRFYRVWEEIGAVQNRPMVFHDELVRVEDAGGRTFKVYTDIDKLEQHMKELAPADLKVIVEYTNAAHLFTRLDLASNLLFGPEDKAALQALAGEMAKWGRISMKDYAARFTDPFMRRAFSVIQYSGSLEFSKAIESSYIDLGGETHYRSKVERILVEDNRAMGVRLEDGTEKRADIVVSAADGTLRLRPELGS
jgi:phytoene dehydrogenase-like protein